VLQRDLRVQIKNGNCRDNTEPLLPLTKLCRKCGNLTNYKYYFHAYYCPHCYDFESVNGVDKKEYL
jgi:hypothetical protein